MPHANRKSTLLGLGLALGSLLIACGLIACGAGKDSTEVAANPAAGSGPGVGQRDPALPPLPYVAGLTFPTQGPNLAPMNTVLAFPNLAFSQPLFLTYSPDGSNRLFVVEQSGKVYVFPNDPAVQVTQKKLFLDISTKVYRGHNEEGMLGLAFDPQYQQNGFFYLHYSSIQGAPRHSVIAHYKVSDQNPDQADANSEHILLQVPQPFGNHNGGMLAFGPDAYLYISMGDGGSGGDPFGHGQNKGTLLGSILRIDPHGSGPNLNYGIPSDNPFVGESGSREEIWAYGLRNTWRFSFDRNTGELWAADVGQNIWEEVDKVVKGGNYGWNYFEGNASYQGTPPANLNDIKPFLVYSHSVGRSITGGYVYRGSLLPELRGAYLYADYSTGRVFAATSKTDGSLDQSLQVATLSSVTSFGEDQAGEVYLVSRGGSIYQLDRQGPGSQPAFPNKLSQTGLFSDTQNLVPTARLRPYTITESFWSDDALKQRWLALPDQGQITFQTDQPWSFPEGSVLVKHFELPLVSGDANSAWRLETRVLVHEVGGWAGYVYKWNQQQDDADLLPGALSQDYQIQDPNAPGGVRTQTWEYPGRANCLECHTQVADFVLGVHTRQINRRASLVQHGIRGNQLQAWNQMGMFTTDIGAIANYTSYAWSQDRFVDREDRVRSYLATNCAQCHQPGGPGQGSFDLRYSTPLAATGLLNAAPQSGDLGLNNAALIRTSSKESSVLWERMRLLGPTRMPPLGSQLVDQAAVDLIGEWIDSLPP